MESTRRANFHRFGRFRPRTGFISVGGFGHYYLDPVMTNAVVTWTTEYYSLAVTQLRAQGRDIPDQILAHISSAHSENINFFGIITVDIESELAKLDSHGRRPLRR